MQFQESCIAQVAYKIIGLKAQRVGAAVRLKDLHAEWTHTGLRTGDLWSGLAQLNRRGYIVLESHNGDSVATLRRPIPKSSSFEMDVAGARALLMARGRRPGQAPVADRRIAVAV